MYRPKQQFCRISLSANTEKNIRERTPRTADGHCGWRNGDSSASCVVTPVWTVLRVRLAQRVLSDLALGQSVSRPANGPAGGGGGGGALSRIHNRLTSSAEEEEENEKRREAAF